LDSLSSISSDDEKNKKNTVPLNDKKEQIVEEEEDEFSKFLQIQTTITKNRKSSVADNNLIHHTNSAHGGKQSAVSKTGSKESVNYPNMFR
jgi:hypothetical protein